MFNDFKPVLKILLRFIIIYVVLLFAYQFYLNTQKGELDIFSKIVAAQSNNILHCFGYTAEMVDVPNRETSWFYVNDKYTSRMVEGCNAISVMILFVSFILAFFNGFKTFIFIIFGIIFLHIVNISRIAGLNYLLLEHPKYSKIGHDYFFPAIIYGGVVLLWLLWINFFTVKVKKHEVS